MPKPSILALHGFTGSGEDFKEFSPFCHTLGAWHCPDLPGHGNSGELDCTPEETVGFIHTQASNLSLQPSILLGYSMGARAALQHACAYPEFWDALILISTNPGIESSDERAERRESDEKLATRIESEGAQAFLEFWQSTPMIRSQQGIRPEWRAAMQASRAKHTEAGLARSLREFGQGSCPNLWPELSKLTIPTLLITGVEDIKYTRIAERISKEQMRHAIIDGAGHMPHLEQAEATAESINQFVLSLRPE